MAAALIFLALALPTEADFGAAPRSITRLCDETFCTVLAVDYEWLLDDHRALTKRLQERPKVECATVQVTEPSKAPKLDAAPERKQ